MFLTNHLFTFSYFLLILNFTVLDKTVFYWRNWPRFFHFITCVIVLDKILIDKQFPIIFISVFREFVFTAYSELKCVKMLSVLWKVWDSTYFGHFLNCAEYVQYVFKIWKTFHINLVEVKIPTVINVVHIMRY